MHGMLRSMLFVPADSERKLAKGAAGAADALVLDLEDSVVPERRPFARGLVRAYLDGRGASPRQQTWVRVNPLDTPEALAELAAVIGGAADGILLPKTRTADDAVRLGHYLTALEQRDGVTLGATRIIAVSTETPMGDFNAVLYATRTDKLFTLGTATGGAVNNAVSDQTPEYELARIIETQLGRVCAHEGL